MLYRKNIFAWEQVMRIVVGIAATGRAVVASGGGWLGWGAGLAGVFLVVSGFFGYCPACAAIGRPPVKSA